MSFAQFVGYPRPSLPPPPSTPQISGRSPSTSPSTPRCCDNGRPIITDPHTGQSICSCQYPTALLASIPRVPTIDGYPPLHPHAGLVPVGADASAFYSPLANTPYDLKDSAEAWRSLQQGGCFTYDPAMALYPYPGYGGLDLNGARRKNATRETTTTLKHWLYEHRKNPYPTKGEKIMLAIITKMTLTQVSTWFANARRRLKKENKMTWTPRNRADDGLENCNNDDSDIDIDDELDDEDKEKLKRAGLLSPTDERSDELVEDRLSGLDDRLHERGDNDTRPSSSHRRDHATSAVNSPIDMRKSPDVDDIDSDCSEPEAKRHKSESTDSHTFNDTETETNDKTTDRSRHSSHDSNSNNNNKDKNTKSDSKSTANTSTPKIWSVSEFLNNNSSDDDDRKSESPIITTQVHSIPTQSDLQPRCGMTLIPSPHGWIGCRVPYGYSLPTHSIPYQYALRQHLIARNVIASKPTTFVSQSDLLRRTSGSHPGIFSPGRDIDSLRSRIVLDKSSTPLAI